MKNMSFKVKHTPLKRAFDILFSLAVLIFFSPLFLLIAIAIWAFTRGSVIYSHERIGRGGRPFQCYKFRTMYPDADARLQDLLDANPDMHEEWKQRRKLKNDPRIMPIGHFLRKTSLDELPQFWNVLKGELSIVGPRPVVHEEVQHYLGEKAEKILSIRPGLTCIWQVSGRNDTSYQARVSLDEQYVDNRSWLLDIGLIIKTIPSMFFSKGAY